MISELFQIQVSYEGYEKYGQIKDVNIFILRSFPGLYLTFDEVVDLGGASITINENKTNQGQIKDAN